MKPITSLVLCCALGSALAAQTPIGGNVYDGNGGPLLSGVVYHASSNISVPVGQILTIQAGAIVKLSNETFSVNGTLHCLGTAVSPVVLTSIHDDAAGGDTNGNGNATTGGVNQWYGLYFNSASSACSLSHTVVRYTGVGGWPNLLVTNSDVTVTDCAITDGGHGGMTVNGTSMPTVSGCSFERIQAQPAVSGLSFDSVPGFAHNTATACSGGNYMLVERGTLAANITIDTNNCLSGVLAYTSNLSVPTGLTLTLGPGMVLKAVGNLTFTVNGTLIANGTAGNPVYLTSMHDDAAGGDTNGNGNASTGGVNQWYGVYFNSASNACSLSHTLVRYTGVGGWPNLLVTNSDVTVTDCAITDGGHGGMTVNGTSMPTVSGCSFERIQAQPAVSGLSFDNVPNFDANSATNCPGGNYMNVERTTLGANTTINTNNCLGGVLAYTSNLSVPTGLTLTLGPGMVLKAVGNLTFTVNGTLIANGTAGNPVYLTSMHDDAAGGDTNGNGNASTGGVNQWYGVYFNSASNACSLSHTLVRYTGVGGWPNLLVTNSDVTVTDCAITDGGHGGMTVNGTSMPTVSGCSFERIQAQPAVSGLSFDSVPGFTHNTATACSGGNYMLVERTTLLATTTIDADNTLGGVLVVTANVSVPVNTTFTLGSGIVMKSSGAITWTINGGLLVNGPVAFTSIHDDLFGGDTNGNAGATSPGPNQWYGMRFSSTASGNVDLAIVRCAGIGGWPGITCLAANTSLSRCRVDLCGSAGFDISAAASVTDLSALANGGDGIQLRTASFNLLRCTSAYNGGAGLRSFGWIGLVRSSLAFGNGSTGFSGFNSGQVDFSNGAGIVGGIGNVNVDPLFLNAGAGDLRLSPNSPCIDSGDPADAPAGRDALGFPRYLDGNLDGTQRVDMGSNEFDNVLLLISGNPSPGSTLTIDSFATPPITISLLTLGFQLQSGLPVLNFGSLFVNPVGPFDAIAWPANGTRTMTIPGVLAVPLPFAFQLVGLANPFPRGNTSNPIHLTIE